MFIISRMNPEAQELIGEEFTHYAYLMYGCDKTPARYDDYDNMICDAVVDMNPNTEMDVKNMVDLNAFCDNVCGKMVNYTPTEFTKILSDSKIGTRRFQPVGDTWLKRHVWVGFDIAQPYEPPEYNDIPAGIVSNITDKQLDIMRVLSKHVGETVTVMTSQMTKSVDPSFVSTSVGCARPSTLKGLEKRGLITIIEEVHRGMIVKVITGIV